MLRDNQGRARTARLVFLLLALCSATIVLLVGIASPQGAVVTGGAAVVYGLIGLSSLLYLALFIGSYVVLIMWLRRAYYNLHQIPGIYPEYSDGWAAGAWFVPFINFVRPYTIMREVWLDTQRAAASQSPQPATVLGWWWAVFLLHFVIGRLIWALVGGAEAGRPDLSGTAFDAGTQLLSALFTWYIIGRMARFEEQLALRQQVAQLGQAAPEIPAALLGEQLGYGQVEGY